jgi:hypothetical protein
MDQLHDKPLASEGLTSYRYKGRLGYIMIGARTHAEALSEANRSLTTGRAELARLDIWNGSQYVPAQYAPQPELAK